MARIFFMFKKSFLRENGFEKALSHRYTYKIKILNHIRRGKMNLDEKIARFYFEERAKKMSFILKVTLELKDKALSLFFLSEGKKKIKETKARGLKVVGEDVNFKKKSKVKKCFYKLICEWGDIDYD